MKLMVITYNKNGFPLFFSALENNGIEIHHCLVEDLALKLDNETGEEILYENDKVVNFDEIDGVYSLTIHVPHINNYFVNKGLWVWNSSEYQNFCSDKYAEMKFIRSLGYNIPSSIIETYGTYKKHYKTPFDIFENEHQLILKPNDDFGGSGVNRIIKERCAILVKNAKTKPRRNVIIEPFVNETSWIDHRYITLDGNFWYCFQRSNPGKVMSNVAQGGIATDIEPDPKVVEMVERIDRAIPYHHMICGFDIMYNKEHEPVVIEMNPNPTMNLNEINFDIERQKKVFDEMAKAIINSIERFYKRNQMNYRFK